MIKKVPTYGKFLKDLCIMKRKIKLSKNTFLTKQVNVIIKNKVLVKYCPTILVQIGDSFVERALLNLRVGVNLLLYFIYKKLGLEELNAIAITLSFAYCSIKEPKGVVKDVFGASWQVTLPSGFCGIKHKTSEELCEFDSSYSWKVIPYYNQCSRQLS